MGIDFGDYLGLLGHEKYRGILIHTSPESSRALSQFAQQIQARFGGVYLDLQAHFSNNPGLGDAIDQFEPAHFKTLLQDQSAGTNLVVVDRADFLLDAWRKPQRQAFYRLMLQQWNSFLETTKAIPIVCLQTSDEIRDMDVRDSRGQNRIHHLSEFNDLK